jgi:D-beta-D-heptose 7-phosphate kinase / D-beta-D-heptose 1-phosphate adenosyltransferase
MKWNHAKRERVVFTNGCFDILHPGHLSILKRARALGDELIVGLNDDESVRCLKGCGRPINNVFKRMDALIMLPFVDSVIVFNGDTPEKLIQTISPDVIVKGEDYTDKPIAGREYVESYGGKVVLLPLLPGYSTTKIIKEQNAKDIRV